MSRLDDAVFSCGRVLSQCVRGSPRSAAVKRKAIWCYGSLGAFSAAALAGTSRIPDHVAQAGRSEEA